MLSSQMLQSTLEGFKTISKVDFCVLDKDGKAIAGTYEEPKLCEKAFALFERPFSDGQEAGGFRCFNIRDEGHRRPEYILISSKEGDGAYLAGKMAAFHIQNLLAAHKETYDTDNFIKNLILGNLLPVDIYNGARKLHIDRDVKRVIYIIEIPDEKGNDAADSIKSLIGASPRDFITVVDAGSVVVIKELYDRGESRELRIVAERMLESLKGAREPYLRIAYGTAFSDIKDAPKSYREARLALDVGRIFFRERKISAYGALGIGRLIYQLPIPLCRMFIKEIYGGRPTEDFNREILLTVDKFFENSLNVSKTSRELYIHRNTLVYRLDKVQKASGLDLRVFEDAVTFKIALMVVQYMKYMESREQ